MAMPNKKGWLAIVFIVLCLAIPFGITYYVSTSSFKAKFDRWREKMPEVPEGASLAKSRIINDQVVLVMGERIHVGKTSLIYRGRDGGLILLDLYIEELDPDHAYRQSFSTEGLDGKTLGLGDISYAITSVSNTTLVLTILEKTGTW